MADWRRPANGKTEEMLDHENQARVEGLANKISRLKGVAVDLETESRDSNRYLDDMTDDFSGTTGLLSGSIHRINNMMSSGRSNRRIMCYIIVGLIVLFFITYYLVVRVTR